MRIRWTDLAARDLTEICDYIEEHNSTSTAHRVAVSIHDRVNALVEFPESGRPGYKTGTRELVLSGLPYFAVIALKRSAQLLEEDTGLRKREWNGTKTVWKENGNDDSMETVL